MNTKTITYSRKQKEHADRLKLIIDYIFVLGLPYAILILTKIFIVKLSKKKIINLPIPFSRRSIQLRTLSSDIAVYNQIFIRREYDIRSLIHSEEFEKRLKANGSDLLILDCGANVGCGVAWFACNYPNARIVAIEPDEENTKILSENAKQFPNVTILRGAIWSSQSPVAIANPDDAEWAYRMISKDTNPRDSLGDIEGITINNLIAKHGPASSILVKMDIEGAENEVFGGDTSWLNHTALLIVELHDNMYPWEGNSCSCIAALNSHKFDYQIIGENLFCFNHE